MIAIYNETWKFLVKQFGYTSRHPQINPFYMIDTLHDFIQSCDDTILDIGCGDFNLKWAYPDKKWYGIDKTIEADAWGYPGEEAWNELEHYKYGVAINSIHHGDLESNLIAALEKVDKLYVTINENKDIDVWKFQEYWSRFGKVEYFWHGQKSTTIQQMSAYMQNDTMYKDRFKQDISLDHIKHVSNNGILKDPYYGVVRVIISNE